MLRTDGGTRKAEEPEQHGKGARTRGTGLAARTCCDASLRVGRESPPSWLPVRKKQGIAWGVTVKEQPVMAREKDANVAANKAFSRQPSSVHQEQGVIKQISCPHMSGRAKNRFAIYLDQYFLLL